jgi:2Fe-2S ferredoxin
VPKVEFMESVFGPSKTVDAPDGGALVDLCDLHYAPIPFSCRSATCGTCHVVVVQGEELFEPPNDAESRSSSGSSAVRRRAGSPARLC